MTLANLAPVMLLLAVMTIASVIAMAAAFGLVNGVVARALSRAGWFISGGPTFPRHVVSALVLVVTAGAVLATRPLWLWISVTSFSYTNPIFTDGDPGLVDCYAVACAVAAALAGAWLTRRWPAARRAWTRGQPVGSRAFAGAAGTAGAVLIAAVAAVSLVSGAAAIPADIARPAFWWQPDGPVPGGSAGAFFAVALGSYDGGPATVYRATGYGLQVRRVAEIQPPTGEEFTDISTLGNDQTFLLTTVIPSNAPVVRSYEVRLAADGRPGPLTQVRLPDAGDLAFSPDGRQIAWVVPGRRRTQIMVLTLASRVVCTWSAPGQVANLSWAGDRAIAFMWSPPMRSGPGPAAGLRVLDTTAPGHDLLRSRLLIPASAHFGDLRRLSSDSPVVITGPALFALMTSPRSAPGGPRTAIVEFSGRTGQPLRVLGEDHQADSGSYGDSGSYCGVVWADPAGQHVLSSCGSTVSRLAGSTSTSWPSGFWAAFDPFAA